MSNVPTKPNALVKKLVEVAQAVSGVKKTGYNQHQNYHYTTESDLVESVKTELLNRNVFVFTTSKISRVDTLTNTDKEGKTKTSLVTSVETIHTFIDGDTGESYSVASAGSGHDATDKGVFKAITGAFKYFISKNFLIASEDDPENDGVTATKPVTKNSGSLFSNKKVESKKEVEATKTEPKQETAPTTQAPIEAAPTPAPVKKEETKPVSNGSATLTNKPVFNRNKAANENVKF